MTEKFTSEFANKVNQWLVDGQVLTAREHLMAARLNHLSRRLTLEFATLCRRAGLNDLCLRALAPYIRPTKPTDPATDLEIVEYATALSRIGSNREALQLLLSCKDVNLPRIQWVRANISVTEWNYSESVKSLKAYLSAIDPVSYEGIVTRTNICAGLIFLEELTEAEIEIQKLLVQCSERQWTRMKTGIQILEIVLNFTKGDHGKTAKLIDALDGGFSRLEDRYQRLILKWRAVNNLMQKRDPEALQEMAAAKRIWTRFCG